MPDDVSVDAYNQILGDLAFEVSHSPSETPKLKCDLCGGADIKRVLLPPTTYVRGYGYLDKKGASRDRDLYLMVNNKDPYKEHRKPGDKEEIVGKLRKGGEYNPNSTTVHL